MILSKLERDKINLDLPLFTLDVNQVALNDPRCWSPEMQGLAPLEWNYFMRGNVELCVTPETAFEITKGKALDSLPYRGYQRIKKTEFFKNRPAGTTLDLSREESTELWTGIKDILWYSVRGGLNQRQLSDVNQLFYHTVSSGSTCYNTVFLTIDNHFISKKDVITSELGVTVLTPSEAWEEYRPSYHLYVPTQNEVDQVVEDQRVNLINLSTRSSTGL